MIIDPWQVSVEVARVWVPFVSALTVIWRVFVSARKSVNAWADKLLDNHLEHIQQSLDKQTALLEKIAQK